MRWTHPRHPLIEARHLVSYSNPFLVGTAGVNVRFIARRFVAGETIAELADDYGTTNAGIEAALRFEFDTSAKRAHRKWFREQRP